MVQFSYEALLACSRGAVVLLYVPDSSKYQVARADNHLPGTRYVWYTTIVSDTWYLMVRIEK